LIDRRGKTLRRPTALRPRLDGEIISLRNFGEKAKYKAQGSKVFNFAAPPHKTRGAPENRKPKPTPKPDPKANPQTTPGKPKMAIAYARTKSLNRADGYNAVKSSAYACRERMTDEQTGAIFDFRPKGKTRRRSCFP